MELGKLWHKKSSEMLGELLGDRKTAWKKENRWKQYALSRESVESIEWEHATNYAGGDRREKMSPGILRFAEALWSHFLSRHYDADVSADNLRQNWA